MTQVSQVDNIVSQINQYIEISEGFEGPLNLVYLGTLLLIVGTGVILGGQELVKRRDFDEAIKQLSEKIEKEDVGCEEYLQYGYLMSKKKLWVNALKNFEKCKQTWDGEEADLAQVYNASGFSYTNIDKYDLAIKEYQRAVKLQPNSTQYWNNLAFAFEKVKNNKEAIKCYQEVLKFDPQNSTASKRSEDLRQELVSTK